MAIGFDKYDCGISGYIVLIFQIRANSLLSIDFQADQIGIGKINYVFIGEYVGIQPTAPASRLSVKVQHDEFFTSIGQSILIRNISPGIINSSISTG